MKPECLILRLTGLTLFFITTLLYLSLQNRMIVITQRYERSVFLTRTNNETQSESQNYLNLFLMNRDHSKSNGLLRILIKNSESNGRKPDKTVTYDLSNVQRLGYRRKISQHFLLKWRRNETDSSKLMRKLLASFDVTNLRQLSYNKTQEIRRNEIKLLRNITSNNYLINVLQWSSINRSSDLNRLTRKLLPSSGNSSLQHVRYNSTISQDFRNSSNKPVIYKVRRNIAAKNLTKILKTSPVSQKHQKLQNYLTLTAPSSTARLGNAMFMYASEIGIASRAFLIPVYPDSGVLHQYYNISAALSSSVQINSFTETVFENYPCKYDEAVERLDNTRNVRLLGYFQSWKYFKAVQDKIRQEFQFSDSLRLKAATALRQIRDLIALSQNNLRDVVFIGVHIRRSDMLEDFNTQKGYIVSNADYIQRATSYYINKINETSRIVFVVCSDDMEWSLQEFPDSFEKFVRNSTNSQISHLNNSQLQSATSTKLYNTASQLHSEINSGPSVKFIRNSTTLLTSHFNTTSRFQPSTSKMPSRQNLRSKSPQIINLNRSNFLLQDRTNAMYSKLVVSNLRPISVFNIGGALEDDLSLLVECNHTIMTVGTFGWWAGFLAGGETVYDMSFPKPGSLLANGFSSDDYFPSHWVGM